MKVVARRVLTTTAAVVVSLGGLASPGRANPSDLDACAPPAPTAEEIAGWNEESDALAAYLSARGVAYDIETDDLGVRTVVWDYEDEATALVVDDFYWERYPPTPEDLAAWNQEADEQAAYMEAHGVAVTVTTDRHGVRSVDWDISDDNAAQVLDDFYWEKYPLPAEDVERINEEADELAAYLGARGIAHDVTEDRHGIRVIEWNYDDDTANAAADAFYAAKYPVIDEESVPVCE